MLLLTPLNMEYLTRVVFITLPVSLNANINTLMGFIEPLQAYKFIFKPHLNFYNNVRLLEARLFLYPTSFNEFMKALIAFKHISDKYFVVQGFH